MHCVVCVVDTLCPVRGVVMCSVHCVVCVVWWYVHSDAVHCMCCVLGDSCTVHNYIHIGLSPCRVLIRGVQS